MLCLNGYWTGWFFNIIESKKKYLFDAISTAIIGKYQHLKMGIDIKINKCKY